MGNNLEVLSQYKYKALNEFVNHADSQAWEDGDLEFGQELVQQVYLGFWGRLGVMISSLCCCGSQAGTAKLVADVVRPFLDQLKRIDNSAFPRAANPQASSAASAVRTRSTRAPKKHRVSRVVPTPPASTVVRVAPTATTPAPQAQIDFSQRPVISFGTTRYTITSRQELFHAMYASYHQITRDACEVTFAGSKVRIRDHAALQAAFLEAETRRTEEADRVATLRGGSQVGAFTLAAQVAAAARSRRAAS